MSLQALRQPEEPWISQTHDVAFGAIPFVPSDNNLGLGLSFAVFWNF